SEERDGVLPVTGRDLVGAVRDGQAVGTEPGRVVLRCGFLAALRGEQTVEAVGATASVVRCLLRQEGDEAAAQAGVVGFVLADGVGSVARRGGVGWRAGPAGHVAWPRLLG